MKTGEVNLHLSYDAPFPEQKSVDPSPKKASDPNYSRIDRLLADGVPVNDRDHRGRTLLHVLVLGGLSSQNAKEALRSLLWRGASLWFRDDFGDTPLLFVRHLLDKRRYDEATSTTKILLEVGADVSCVNKEKCSLLSYSLQHLDNSFDLTRLLFNYGASVWGFDDALGDDNAFKWLLLGIMKQRKLVNHDRSLSLVSGLMSGRPAKMETLVIRTLTRHSTCYQVYGPLFKGIHSEMKTNWTEPQKLSHLCRLKIRESLRDSVLESIALLSLPQVVENFILFREPPR